MNRFGIAIVCLLVGTAVSAAASNLDQQMQYLVGVVKALKGAGGQFDAGNMETELYYSSKVLHSIACGLQLREQQLATHKTSEITENRVTEYVLDFSVLKLLTEKKKSKRGFPAGVENIVVVCADDDEACVRVVDGKTRAKSGADHMVLQVQDTKQAGRIAAAMDKLIDACD